MYESQTVGKNHRAMCKLFTMYHKSDQLHEEMRKKYFKRFYAGKPTKRYLRIMNAMNESDRLERMTF
jgi:hypothetical protein